MLTAADPVIGGFAKDSEMGRKSILESTPNMPNTAVVIYVGRRIVELPIELWKACVYCVSTGACEKAAAAANYVWR